MKIRRKHFWWLLHSVIMVLFQTQWDKKGVMLLKTKVTQDLVDVIGICATVNEQKITVSS